MLFGCGAPFGSCTGLNAILGIGSVPAGYPWDVGTDGTHERQYVKKLPGAGGVLCCADSP